MSQCGNCKHDLFNESLSHLFSHFGVCPWYKTLCLIELSRLGQQPISVANGTRFNYVVSLLEKRA